MILILTMCDFSAKIKIFLLMITFNINKYLRDFLALLSPIANNLAHAKLKSIRLTFVFFVSPTLSVYLSILSNLRLVRKQQRLR